MSKKTRGELLALLADMSIEEKAGQLAQIPISACMAGVTEPTGPMAELNLTPEQICLAGSLISVAKMDAGPIADVVRTITECQPHHIPPLVMKDVIHGHQTMFPIPLAIGCTFDEGVAEEMSRCGAMEGAASGTHVTFAPMVDVVRDPRWGRVMESPGESPVLCAAMGAAMVRGTRGDDIAAPDRIAACAKHFLGYGLSQAGQDYAPIDVSRTEIWNTYLPPFEACVKAGVDMMMPAFVAVDRVPCVCNEWLLKDVLRERLGFEGMIISDWNDPQQLMNHGLAENLPEVAKRCINAGLDMDMMSFAYLNHLADLVHSGEVDEAKLDASCLKVLELKNELGLFDAPVKNGSSEVQQAVCGSEEIRRAAFEAAVKSCVLLKNDGALPLKPGMKVCLTGSHADEHAILGGWTLDADTEATKTLRMSLAEDSRITLVPEEEADVILFAAGERQQDTGEDTSKAHPELSAEQLAELRRLHVLGKPVALLLFCGRPLILTEALPLCDALLNVWFPGSEGADAIRALVMGDRNPSGHASMTFPRCVGQIPVHHDRLSSARPWQADTIYVNRYKDESIFPLFPFGFGLSYTTFAVEGAVSGRTLTACVTNTGDRAGETVVQVYGRLRHSDLIRPDKRLLCWQRVSLQPGETRELTFDVTPEMLLMYDAQGRPVEARGLCDVALGEDSAVPYTLTVDFE